MGKEDKERAKRLRGMGFVVIEGSGFWTGYSKPNSKGVKTLKILLALSVCALISILCWMQYQGILFYNH